MISGQNNTIQPLLTIAIPTWNRANQLGEALNHLLPQIEHYTGIIEFIISDNASSDNTIDIIDHAIKKYQSINFILYRQKENNGFFGNFHKCISLGTGKYFWLLSDDDFVFEGVISLLINIFKEEEVGAVFLNDWTGDKTKKEIHTYKYTNQKSFFKEGPHRHSLISGIIYRNTIKGNDKIFEMLKGNPLIGYAVYLNAINKYDKFVIIYGNSLQVRNDQITRFNALKIFTLDLSECLKIAYKYYPKEIVNRIANSFLSAIISGHYRNYKYKNLSKHQENNAFYLFGYYLKYINFWIYIFPFILLPKPIYLFLKKRLYDKVYKDRI
ncbi:MAG: glycosyltransferase family 2 protein [Prolixibacteraceae bacterium]|jgi:glycosyltransferase involved in cell wall biosynthesis